jgi:hypothetical protein
MKKTDGIDACERPTAISDSGTSSTGIFDTGTVRVGALSPSFPANRSGPPDASDTSKVRIGALSPAFPALRTK